MLHIIVPYRDRERQKKILTETLHKFLTENLNDSFHIYVIEQNEEKDFNKGCILNAGFMEVNKDLPKGDYFCLHDVDVVPKTTEANYNKPPKGCIIHPYGHWHCLSNIIVINPETYLRLNGFSTKFWKWGYEDTEFLIRANYHKIKLMRENFTERFRSKIYKELDKQNHGDMTRKSKELSAQVNKIHFDNSTIHPEQTKKEGLNTTKYTVLEKTEHEFYTNILIRIENENKNYQYMKHVADYHKYLISGMEKRKPFAILSDLRNLFRRS